MTEQDFHAFGVELGKTATALLYKLDPATIGEYFEVLKAHPLGKVCKALEAARRWSKYMPRPADVLGYMGVGEEHEPRLADLRTDRALVAHVTEPISGTALRALLEPLRAKYGWLAGATVPTGADTEEELARLRALEADDPEHRARKARALKALRGAP